jgi:hypothetical protein
MTAGSIAVGTLACCVSLEVQADDDEEEEGVGATSSAIAWRVGEALATLGCQTHENRNIARKSAMNWRRLTKIL